MVATGIPIAHPEEARIFKRRLQFLNRELPFSIVGLAIGSACSDTPGLFSYISALRVLVVIHYFDKPYQSIFKLWREERHPLTRVRLVWRSYLPFLVAWLALGAVAAGFVNKAGFVFLH